ncbi:MAG: hypothetical protein GY797_10570 [Deltaproteobacteria bacterium]|nr:hypothetical protein [Deltaproteobacteria bacterium]
MYINPIFSDKDADTLPDWVLFEHGEYSNPIAILKDYDIEKVVKAWLEANPEKAQELIQQSNV